jgi:hypothetical protein
LIVWDRVPFYVESPAHKPCTHKNEGKGKIRVKGRRKDKKRGNSKPTNQGNLGYRLS